MLIEQFRVVLKCRERNVVPVLQIIVGQELFIIRYKQDKIVPSFYSFSFHY